MIRIPDRRSSLSGRARSFLARSPVVARPGDSPDPLLDPAWEGHEEVLRTAIAFDEAYRNIVVASGGGPLKGDVTLGVVRSRPVWRTRDGLEIFRCADLPTLQCAIVASSDGRMGCSWSGEFTTLFDSVEQFVENAAAWDSIGGWEYCVIGQLPLGLVLGRLQDVRVDADVSGEVMGWWISPDRAVVSDRLLNPALGNGRRVSVLARTPEIRDETRAELAGHPWSAMSIKTADVFGTVPVRRP